MIGILHLIDSYRTGGPGKTILNSARFIDRARYDLRVGAFTHPDPARNEFQAAVARAALPFLALQERRRFDPGHLVQLRRYLRQNRIGVLHTHGYRSDLLGYLATRGTPTAIVTTHHGWIRNTRRQRVMVRLALALSRGFDGVEVVSQKLTDDLPERLRCSDRVAVVHNAIVLGDYVPEGRRDEVRRGLGVPAGSTLLAVIGRLSPEKGCTEMVAAFDEIARAWPGAHLAFVGEGPLGDELASAAAARGLADRVHLPGHHARVQPFYEAADVVVSPSRTEGLSNVLLEALAFGRPVVATRVGGNAEIIADGTSGLLVEPRNPGALAAAVTRLLSDAMLCERLSEQGRRRVVAEFTFEARMRKEERFYDHVLRARTFLPAAASARWDRV